MMNPQIPIDLALETERLVIRAPKEAHAATLREAIAESMNELRLWMPWAQSVPTIEASTENCKKAEAEFAAGSDYRLHIFLKETQTLIGCSGLHRIEWDVPSVEIGYWIRTPYSGKGYMTEAVREITRYAAEELNMNRVEIRMSADNARSKAVPERLGFTHEGTLRNHDRHMDGSLRDTCVFAWTRGIDCRMPIVECRLSNADCRMPIVECRLSNADCRMPIVECRLSNADCRMPIVECRLSNADCRMPIVECRLSNADCRMPIVECRLSNADCRMPIVECRLSNADCRMPIVECRLSNAESLIQRRLQFGHHSLKLSP